MAFRWRADDGPTLNAGLVFQGLRTSLAKKPYIFVIFQRGPTPCPPPPLLDPRMNKLLCWYIEQKRYLSSPVV